MGSAGEDQVRWGDLALRYRTSLQGFFARRVRNPSDVDDLVQDVFTYLLKRAPGKPIEQIEPYLFQTAANVLRERARRGLVRHQDAHESFDEIQHAPSSDLSPERIFLGKEAIQLASAALRELPERTRDMFVLHVLEQRSCAEIARLLGISTRAVEKQVAKALAHVDKVLDWNRR